MCVASCIGKFSLTGGWNRQASLGCSSTKLLHHSSFCKNLVVFGVIDSFARSVADPCSPSVVDHGSISCSLMAQAFIPANVGWPHRIQKPMQHPKPRPSSTYRRQSARPASSRLGPASLDHCGQLLINGAKILERIHDPEVSVIEDEDDQNPDKAKEIQAGD